MRQSSHSSGIHSHKAHSYNIPNYRHNLPMNNTPMNVPIYSSSSMQSDMQSHSHNVFVPNNFMNQNNFNAQQLSQNNFTPPQLNQNNFGPQQYFSHQDLHQRVIVVPSQASFYPVVNNNGIQAINSNNHSYPNMNSLS